MNVPWELEHPCDGHLPHTLGQCDAISAVLEHHACTCLLFRIQWHLKGMPLPPVVLSRSFSGESSQGGAAAAKMSGARQVSAMKMAYVSFTFMM
mmetsp:Transcript_9567/g.13889  ORF Transcript_9567/g.13889 Transcript_9567/m.13889 type:complete len:94 (-) Transcript_9567:127-408(-)